MIPDPLLYGFGGLFHVHVLTHAALPHHGPRKAFSGPRNDLFDIRLDKARSMQETCATQGF